MYRRLLTVLLAVLLLLSGCSSKKTVEEDLTEFLNTELEIWRAEDETIEGIHATDITVEVSSLIDDPRYKGCYIATLDFYINTDEAIDPDIFWLCEYVSRLYNDDAADRFLEEYGHYVSIYGADSLDSFLYDHYNVTVNGTLVRSSQEQGERSKESFDKFVEEYGTGDGVVGNSGASCRRCGTGYAYGSTGYNLIKENGYCGNCRNNTDDE